MRNRRRWQTHTPVFKARGSLSHDTKHNPNKSPARYTQKVRMWIWKRTLKTIWKKSWYDKHSKRRRRVSNTISLRSGSKRQKRENKMSGKVMNCCFSGSEVVTVYVLITSTERDWKPETFMALTLWVYFPSICAFPDSFSSSNLTLQHCHTPRWLPWRNSPSGLQGTPAYCLWLLYLDETIICWKGSTCFFLVTASLCCHSFLLLFLHDAHCFILPSRSFTVCVKLAWCFVAINFSVSACQRGRSGTKFPPLPQLSPGHIIAFYYQGLSVTRTLTVRTGNFITAGKTTPGVLTLIQAAIILCVSYRCNFLSLLQQKSHINSFLLFEKGSLRTLMSYFCIRFLKQENSNKF